MSPGTNLPDEPKISEVKRLCWNMDDVKGFEIERRFDFSTKGLFEIDLVAVLLAVFDPQNDNRRQFGTVGVKSSCFHHGFQDGHRVLQRDLAGPGDGT